MIGKEKRWILKSMAKIYLLWSLGRNRSYTEGQLESSSSKRPKNDEFNKNFMFIYFLICRYLLMFRSFKDYESFNQKLISLCQQGVLYDGHTSANDYFHYRMVILADWD